MHLRKKTGSACEKENDSPDVPRHDQNKLNRGIGWSPKNQRRRDKPERTSTVKREVLAEQSPDPLTREGSAADGFHVAQRLLKTKIGNAFHQLWENDFRRKDECHLDDRQKDSGDKEERTESARCSSASGRTPGNARLLAIGRSSGNRRNSRAGVEKRKHFQDALTDFRSRILGNSREHNLEGDVSRKIIHFHSEETPTGVPETRVGADRLPGERMFLSPQFSIGSMSTWLPRHNRSQRTSAEGMAGQNKRSPFRIDHFGKGGSGIFGPSSVESTTVIRGDEDDLVQLGSFDTRTGQRGRPRTRRQQRRRNVPLRRTKSSSSLRPQRGSGFHSNLPDELMELSAEASLLDQIQELRNVLDKSERILDDYIEESKKNQAQLIARVDRLGNLYSSLSQSQEIRYKSLLDVFHENYKLLGYVESNFDYVLSVVARGKRTNLQRHFHCFLRFIADHTMAPILGVVRLGSRLYLLLFPRRVAPG